MDAMAWSASLTVQSQSLPKLQLSLSSGAKLSPQVLRHSHLHISHLILN